jgi:hypothetical protein
VDANRKAQLQQDAANAMSPPGAALDLGNRCAGALDLLAGGAATVARQQAFGRGRPQARQTVDIRYRAWTSFGYPTVPGGARARCQMGGKENLEPSVPWCVVIPGARRVLTGRNRDDERRRFCRVLAATTTHRHAWRLTCSRRVPFPLWLPPPIGLRPRPRERPPGSPSVPHLQAFERLPDTGVRRPSA